MEEKFDCNVSKVHLWCAAFLILPNVPRSGLLEMCAFRLGRISNNVGLFSAITYVLDVCFIHSPLPAPVPHPS
jgi:hypothetical protein